MSYNDGGNDPGFGGIKPQPRVKQSQSIDSDNTIDQRVWRRPSTQGQNPAPQSNRPAPPDADDDIAGLAKKSRSQSPVAGHIGIHHVSSEPQYHYSISSGLKTREEGTYAHQFSGSADAEPLHSATVADLKRAKYADDRQGGNSHVAAQFGATLERTGAGQTRLGQGKKPQGDNQTTDNRGDC